MQILNKIRYSLLCSYISLFYYQDLIEKLNLIYDRTVVNHIEYNLRHFQLIQYRKLYPYYSKDTETFPNYVQIPLQLICIKYFVLFWLIRCFSVVFIKSLSATLEMQVLVGTVFFENESPSIEMTLLIWSIVCANFFQFTLTNTLTDYTFLSINRVTEDNNCVPTNFGLDIKHFKRFQTFRKVAWLFFKIPTRTFPPIVFFILQTISIHRGYYYKAPITTTFWVINFTAMTYFMCNGNIILFLTYKILKIYVVLYSNMITFIIIAQYIRIKQRYLVLKIQKSITKNYNKVQFIDNQNKIEKFKSFLWNKFMLANVRYISLTVLGLITYICGCVVHKQVQYCKQFISIVLRSDVVQPKYVPNKFKIKLSNISSNMEILSQSGFNLMNGYVLTHDTFLDCQHYNLFLLNKIRYSLLSSYISLYYYQDLIDKYNIIYDRTVINHIEYNLRHYQLIQYRKLYPTSYSKDVETFPDYVQIPLQLICIKYFILFWLIRCFSIVFIKSLSATLKMQILVGTVFFENDSQTVEMTLLIWSIVCINFFQFTLTNTLTDYKFLSLNRIFEYNNCIPTNFGLDIKHFKRFQTFLKVVWFFFKIPTRTFPPITFFILQTISIQRMGNVSLILLGLITYICGCVVQQQVQYYKHFTSIVLRSDVVYPKHVHNKFKIKLGNISSNMEILSQSGFNLMNGYVLTHDTFRLKVRLNLNDEGKW
ncbi:hypothetical protein BLOT_011863 [Blomia tropicalis]|nr:hypothetical protein BLOT_011863 [Blomia tropicalis]